MPASTAPRKPLGDSDFNVSELVASQESHEKNITELTERVAKLESKMETPQAHAAYLATCAEDSRNFDDVFAKMFIRFMNDNEKVSDALSHLPRSHAAGGTVLS